MSESKYESELQRVQAQLQLVENNFLDVLKVIFRDGVHIDQYQAIAAYLPDIKDKLQFINKKSMQECIDQVVSDIIECDDIFNKVADIELCRALEECRSKADRLHTPWFLGEMIMENKVLSEFVMKNAEFDFNADVEVKWII